MQLGTHLRELSRHRLGAALCLLLAVFVALWACYKISLFPPKLTPRSLEMAAASTHVLVDTPTSTLLDLKQGTYSLTSMSNRALLLGDIMASAPVREYIARRAHVPAGAVKIVTPLTPSQPRPIADSQEQKHTSDIAASTDQYRLNVQADPTVPMLNISAQAPTADAASALANASVDGLRDYLAQIGRTQNIGAARQVRISQLGRARGGVINGGIRIKVGLLAFFFMLGASGATVLVLSRVRSGWDSAAS